MVQNGENKIKFAIVNLNGFGKRKYIGKFAKSDEEKAKIQRDKYQMSLFTMTPESEECKTLLKIKQLEAMIEAQIALAIKTQQLLKLQQANESE